MRWPAAQQLIYGLAATEVAKWIVLGHNQQITAQVWTIDAGALSVRSHPIHTLDCCSATKSLVGGKLGLQDCPKVYFGPDGERSVSPETMLSRLEQYLSPVTGVIADMKHHEVDGTHVCYSVANRPLSSLDDSKGRLRVPEVVVGKGVNKQAARLGCLAEAIERHSAAYSHHDETLVKAPDQMLPEAVLPQHLLHFSEAQYQNREDWNRRWGPQNQIPRRLDSSKLMHWTPAWSLTAKRRVYVPTAYCYLSHPFRDEQEVCPGDSNGLASGACFEEATYYALLEVVERDSIALWWL